MSNKRANMGNSVYPPTWLTACTLPTFYNSLKFFLSLKGTLCTWHFLVIYFCYFSLFCSFVHVAYIVQFAEVFFKFKGTVCTWYRL
ncbi:hypothetical protein X975_07727, partial [Stegodyphus mimosarum]